MPPPPQHFFEWEREPGWEYQHLESLKQDLRVLIPMPHISGIAIIIFCEVLKNDCSLENTA